MFVRVILCLLLLRIAFGALDTKLKRLKNYHPLNSGLNNADYMKMLENLSDIIRADIRSYFYVGIVLDSSEHTLKVFNYFLPGLSFRSLVVNNKEYPRKSIVKLHVARSDYFKPSDILVTFSTGSAFTSDAYGIVITTLANEGDELDADETPIFFVYTFAAELPPPLPEAYKWLDKVESRRSSVRIADLYASDPKYRPLRATFGRANNFCAMEPLLSTEIFKFARAEASRAAAHFRKPVSGLFHEILSSFYPGSLPRILRHNEKSPSLIKKVRFPEGLIANVGDVLLDFQKGFFKAPRHHFILKVLVNVRATVEPDQPLFHVLVFDKALMASTENKLVAPWFGPDEHIFDVLAVLRNERQLLPGLKTSSRNLVKDSDGGRLKLTSPQDLLEQAAVSVSGSAILSKTCKSTKPTCNKIAAILSTDSVYLPLYERTLTQIRSMTDLTKLQELFINRLQLLRQNIPDCKQLTCPIPSVITVGTPIATSLSQKPIEALTSGVAVKSEHCDNHCSIYILAVEE